MSGQRHKDSGRLTPYWQLRQRGPDERHHTLLIEFVLSVNLFVAGRMIRRKLQLMQGYGFRVRHYKFLDLGRCEEVEGEESSDVERVKATCDVMPSLSLLSLWTLISNRENVACT
jgi:endo-1,4-beta-mannosidase